MNVLIIDDDATHLQIYAMIVKLAGYRPVTVLVGRHEVNLATDGRVDLVLLDYCLNSETTAVEAAQVSRSLYPAAPIVLLSDLYGVPPDIAPYITEFVRKGEPEKLVAMLSRILTSQKEGCQA